MINFSISILIVLMPMLAFGDGYRFHEEWTVVYQCGQDTCITKLNNGEEVIEKKGCYVTGQMQKGPSDNTFSRRIICVKDGKQVTNKKVYCDCPRNKREAHCAEFVMANDGTRITLHIDIKRYLTMKAFERQELQYDKDHPEQTY